MWLKGGAGKLKFEIVSTELTYWAEWGVEFVTLPLWIGKALTHSMLKLNAFNAQLKGELCI